MSEIDVSILKKLGALTRQIRKEVSTMPKTGLDITEIIDYIEKRI
jgi:methionine aminopeptidase